MLQDTLRMEFVAFFLNVSEVLCKVSFVSKAIFMRVQNDVVVADTMWNVLFLLQSYSLLYGNIAHQIVELLRRTEGSFFIVENVTIDVFAKICHRQFSHAIDNHVRSAICKNAWA